MKFGLNIKDVMKWTEENVNELYEKILSKHTPEIGITYCKYCHAENDHYRKVKRKDN